MTQKVVQTASRIAGGSGERLTLGRLDIHRDWGWAPEYVDAMLRMMQQVERGLAVHLGRWLRKCRPAVKVRGLPGTFPARAANSDEAP